MFKRCLMALGVVLLAWGVAGCAHPRAAHALEAEPVSVQERGSEVAAPPARMLAWNASLTIFTDDVDTAAVEAVKVAERSGGYMEGKESYGEDLVELRLRIPSKGLPGTLGELEALGTVNCRFIASSDVTEQCVDLEARAKTLAALRDRLKKLLDKADGVNDVLLVEREFSRVQSELESMEARLKSLKAQTDMATVNLTLRRERTLGPFGWFFYSLWWGAKSLFVIQ